MSMGERRAPDAARVDRSAQRRQPPPLLPRATSHGPGPRPSPAPALPPAPSDAPCAAFCTSGACGFCSRNSLVSVRRPHECSGVPMVCLPIWHWYMLRGDWLKSENGVLQ